MKPENEIRKVRDTVSMAIAALHEKHAGANSAEATKYLEEVKAALGRDDLSQALSIAGKAYLAAKPTTEYLLDRAKNLESSGSQAYKDEKFSEAVKLWHESLVEYDRARQSAVEREETEIVKALASTMASIERDIEVAHRNEANVGMHATIAEANKAVDEANERFKAGEFDAAKQKFESARELYAKSATIAEEFAFDDRARIKEAETEMGASIESCLLFKGKALIEATFGQTGSQKEDAFTQTISYLKSFSSSSEMYEELKTRAYQGLALSRIELGTQLMEEAEGLLNKGQYYPAKERYRKAQEHFENIRDFAVEHHLEREKSEADDLMEDCARNIRACTDSMLGRLEIAKGNIVRVEALRRGIRLPTGKEAPSESVMSKLEQEYASIRPLGSGGFGMVFLAQAKDGKVIALKVLAEPKKHEKIFFRELTMWQGLDHRNIVKLISPRYYPVPLFEMEYVDGGDLKELIEKSGRLSPERACRIAFDIAKGLQCAHSSSIIHADLKPRNILLTKMEEAKITDWGLAKIATSSKGSPGYTPGYAAPEQIQKGQQPDRRTDVYQLGLILYEMLTARNPFEGESPADTDEKVLTLIPEKPSRYEPKIEPLDELILSCLDKDPGNRPGTRKFREDLCKYMKQNYGILLKVTWEPREKIDTLCKIALFSVKQSVKEKEPNYRECLQALLDLEANVSNKEIKGNVQSLIGAMRYREKNSLLIDDEVANEIYEVMRQIQYGESRDML